MVGRILLLRFTREKEREFSSFTILLDEKGIAVYFFFVNNSFHILLTIFIFFWLSHLMHKIFQFLLYHITIVARLKMLEHDNVIKDITNKSR